MLMIGPQGSGKTMLAQRLPCILPDLDAEQALTVSALASLLGPSQRSTLMTRPPLQTPHHTATAAAIVGGGSRPIRPGAVSLATHGVLFLDEAAEFQRSVLDALRQCLESREITIHRANDTAVFPAAFQLVMAANPCPCGMDGVVGAICECTPFARRQYLAKLSGPLIDRMDIALRIPKSRARLNERGTITTRAAQAQATMARAAQRERLAPFGVRLNVEVPSHVLHGALRISHGVLAPLMRALEAGALSMRGVDKVLRLAWSVADMHGLTVPDSASLDQAMYFRGAAA